MIGSARPSGLFSSRLPLRLHTLEHYAYAIGKTEGKTIRNNNAWRGNVVANFSAGKCVTVQSNNVRSFSTEINATAGYSQGESGTAHINDKSLLQRTFQKYSISKQKNRILMAESLFQAATTQASDPRWYGPGRIGRDFRSYQALLTMHIWFLHKRLLADEADPHTAMLIQEELFDIFWIDSQSRMRAHGVTEMLINKNLKKVQQYSFMHMFHYDHCYSGDLLENPAERLEALKMTVKTHILLLPSLAPESDRENAHRGDDEDIDEEILRKHVEHDDQAERIAWYIETQFQNIINDLPDEFFEKARIAWTDLPSFDQMIDGNTGKELPNQTVDPKDILPLDWTKSIANDGTYYYWNLKTREALWERPG